jgi:hypothetical protein
MVFRSFLQLCLYSTYYISLLNKEKLKLASASKGTLVSRNQTWQGQVPLGTPGRGKAAVVLLSHVGKTHGESFGSESGTCVT